MRNTSITDTVFGDEILQTLVKMLPLPKRFYYRYGIPAMEGVSVIGIRLYAVTIEFRLLSSIQAVPACSYSG
jgi:hypothetical protein